MQKHLKIHWSLISKEAYSNSKAQDATLMYGLMMVPVLNYQIWEWMDCAYFQGDLTISWRDFVVDWCFRN